MNVKEGCRYAIGAWSESLLLLADTVLLLVLLLGAADV